MATPKATKARKKPAAKTAKAPEVELKISVPEQTQEQKQAKLSAYVTLKNAGLPIPADLQLEVESLIAAAQKRQADAEKAAAKAKTAEEQQIEKENETGQKWLRNCYNAPYSLRLDSQEKKKRIELKPRGQRGDMFPLKDEDMNDSALLENLETGLIEIIPHGTAKNILSKQTHNLQRSHTPLALLRNEKGEEYAEGAVKLEAEYGSQGVVVAVTNPNIDKSNDDWARQGGKAMDVLRPEQVAQFVPTGGNPAIISSGFAPSPEAQAKIADDLARRKGGDGPAAGLGGLTLTVDPVQKT